jgi:hypothetical protein
MKKEILKSGPTRLVLVVLILLSFGGFVWGKFNKNSTTPNKESPLVAQLSTFQDEEGDELPSENMEDSQVLDEYDTDEGSIPSKGKGAKQPAPDTTEDDESIYEL